jgi:hypothetical protein
MSPDGAWKEAPKSPDHDKPLNGLLLRGGGPREGANGLTPEAANAPTLDKHPLYGHGVCKWPGCEAVCDDADTFFRYVPRIYFKLKFFQFSITKLYYKIFRS